MEARPLAQKPHSPIAAIFVFAPLGVLHPGASLTGTLAFRRIHLFSFRNPDKVPFLFQTLPRRIVRTRPGGAPPEHREETTAAGFLPAVERAAAGTQSTQIHLRSYLFKNNCTLILVLVRVQVKGFSTGFVGFVYLHKYDSRFLSIFATTAKLVFGAQKTGRANTRPVIVCNFTPRLPLLQGFFARSAPWDRRSAPSPPLSGYPPPARSAVRRPS